MAIASLARATDFAANLRPVDWLITHPSEVKFVTDTIIVIIVSQSHYFNKSIDKQGLNYLYSAYGVAGKVLGVQRVISRAQSTNLGYLSTADGSEVRQPTPRLTLTCYQVNVLTYTT